METVKKKKVRVASAASKIVRKLPPDLMPTMEQINAKKKFYTACSLFAGGGGSSTGHKMAGADVLYSNEFIPEAVKTYKANHPTTHVDGRDIRTVKASEILKIIGLKKGQLDLLDLSPPCKSFSTAGKGDKGWGQEAHYSDGVFQRTDDLFMHGIRIVRGLMPKVFVAENVPGLVHGSNKGMFLEILQDFKNCGYEVKAKILNASYLGVPQARERLIFIGVRNDLVEKGFHPVYPEPLTSKMPTVKSVLPHVIAFKSKKNGISCYVPSDAPSPTITASDGLTSETAGFSCGGWIETAEGDRRKYTISELKRITTLPEDYVLTGKYEQRFERCGRMVPPMVMYYVSRLIYREIIKPYKQLRRKERESA